MRRSVDRDGYGDKLSVMSHLAEAAQTAIDEVMDHFEFSRVQKAMEALEWTWWGVEGIPDEAHLRVVARKILREVVEKAWLGCTAWSGGTGGFYITATPYDDGFDVEMRWGISYDTASGM